MSGITFVVEVFASFITLVFSVTLYILQIMDDYSIVESLNSNKLYGPILATLKVRYYR